MNAALRRLAGLLAAFQPTDAKEAHDRARMLELAATLAAPFSRAEERAHFTASAVLIAADAERVCLVHHRQLDRWLQPGGHFEDVDAGSMERAALREAHEETGCMVELIEGVSIPFDLDIHTIPAHGDVAEHLHLDLRLLLCTSSTELRHDANGSQDIRWFTWAEALACAHDPSLARLLHKARLWSGGQRLQGEGQV